MSSETDKNILARIENLIQQVKSNSDLLNSIKQRVGGDRWHGFGFETLVRDVHNEGEVEALKKAKKRIAKNPTDESDTNYQNLLNLYNDAYAKYFGNEKIPQIQSISISARKEAKALGIDWDTELKKFMDCIKFRSST